jgi:hypothetical protein
MLHPIQISCVSSNWRSLVITELAGIHEINLIHFLYITDDAFCQEMAVKYLMHYTPCPMQHTATFRKPAPEVAATKPA